MQKRPCCTFHHLGGPAQVPCDNYDHRSTSECPDEEPTLTTGELIEWDIYRDAGLEYGSMVADSQDTYGA